MNDFNSNIQICPNCKGWGILQNPYEKKCSKCNGIGITGISESKTVAFLAPTFIDFQKRQKNNYLSKLISILLFILSFIFLIIFAILFLNIIK